MLGICIFNPKNKMITIETQLGLLAIDGSSKSPIFDLAGSATLRDPLLTLHQSLSTIG
jgi:hypothetical protein